MQKKLLSTALLAALLASCGQDDVNDGVNIPDRENSPGSVAITGDLSVSSTISAEFTDANLLSSTPADPVYVWTIDGVVDDSLTERSFDLTDDFLGATISVEVSYIDDAGFEEFNISSIDYGPVEPFSYELVASFVKGPVTGGSCDVYSIGEEGTAEEGQKITPALNDSPILTDSSGVADFGEIVALEGYVVIECSGGTYTDEATGTTYMAPLLRAVLNTKDTKVTAVTPLTEIAVQKGLTVDGSFLSAVDFNSEIGFDVTEIIPTDLSTTQAADDRAGEYATYLAIYSQLAADNAITATDDSSALEQFIADIADGDFDEDDFTTARDNLIASTSDAAENIPTEIVTSVSETIINGASEGFVVHITDESTGDTGELRYGGSSTSIVAGELRTSFWILEGETATTYVTVYDDSGSLSNDISDFSFVAPGEEFSNPDAYVVAYRGASGREVIDGLTVQQGEWIDVELSWDSTFVEFKVNGVDYPIEGSAFTNQSGNPVSRPAVRLSSNGGTATRGVLVRQFEVYEEIDGVLTPVIVDDFDDFAVGDSLGGDDDDYNSSTFSAVVVNPADIIDAEIVNREGSVAITGTPRVGRTLTAEISDLDIVDDSLPVSYTWALDGTAITGATSSTYDPVEADVGGLITVTVDYTDTFAFAEMHTSAEVGPVEALPVVVDNTGKAAQITDMDTGDTGELRYNFADADFTATGSYQFSVLYPEGETESAQFALFGQNDDGSRSTSTSRVVADLRLDEGNVSFRNNNSIDADVSATFVPGEWFDVEITWTDSNTTSGTYSLTIDGQSFGPFAVESQALVTGINARIASNGGTAPIGFMIDDIAVYSDVAGTAEIFSEDFEGFTVGDDLSDTTIPENEFNSSTFSTFVVSVSDGPGNVAEITDMDTGDTGELRYNFADADFTATGQYSFSVFYPEGETESAQFALFGQNDDGSRSTSTSRVVADLRLDEGNVSFRNNNSIDADVSATFVPGEWLDVVITWTDSNTANGTYSLTIDGQDFGPFAVESQALVTGINARIASNGGTAPVGFWIDDIGVYSDAEGTMEIFSEDFEGFTIGDDLSDTTIPDNEFNSSTFSAFVIDGNPEEGGQGNVAEITDMDTGDTGELRYNFADADFTATGRFEFAVMYPVGETESAQFALFGQNDDETRSTSTSRVVADLRLDEGSVSFRNNNSIDADVSATFVPGEWIQVAITWTDSDTTSGTYSLTIDGQDFGPFEVESQALVTGVNARIASNGGTAPIGFMIDDIGVYSDVDGTVEIFSEDFEQFFDGDDLTDTTIPGNEFNSSSFSVIVVDSNAS